MGGLCGCICALDSILMCVHNGPDHWGGLFGGAGTLPRLVRLRAACHDSPDAERPQIVFPWHRGTPVAASAPWIASSYSLSVAPWHACGGICALDSSPDSLSVAPW